LSVADKLKEIVAESGFELISEEKIERQTEATLKTFLLTSKLLRVDSIALLPPQTVTCVWKKAICKL
jgi:hypothetical protein